MLRNNAKTWTLTASLYSLVLSLIGLQWTTDLLLIQTISPHASFVNMRDFVPLLKDAKVVLIFTSISFSLNVVWLLAALYLLYGNAAEILEPLYCWIAATVTATAWNVAIATYFSSRINETQNSTEVHSVYIVLLVYFSGFFFTWILNILFVRFVLQRSREIKTRSKSFTLRTPTSSGSSTHRPRVPDAICGLTPRGYVKCPALRRKCFHLAGEIVPRMVFYHDASKMFRRSCVGKKKIPFFFQKVKTHANRNDFSHACVQSRRSRYFCYH